LPILSRERGIESVSRKVVRAVYILVSQLGREGGEGEGKVKETNGEKGPEGIIHVENSQKYERHTYRSRLSALQLEQSSTRGEKRELTTNSLIRRLGARASLVSYFTDGKLRELLTMSPDWSPKHPSEVQDRSEQFEIKPKS